MFTYEYNCKDCGMFELCGVPMDKRNEPKVCPKCGNQCNRIWASTPSFAFGIIEDNHFNKPDSYYAAAERTRIANKKKMKKEFTEKYRYDKEFRDKENKKLVSRGVNPKNIMD